MQRLAGEIWALSFMDTSSWRGNIWGMLSTLWDMADASILLWSQGHLMAGPPGSLSSWPALFSTPTAGQEATLGHKYGYGPLWPTSVPLWKGSTQLSTYTLRQKWMLDFWNQGAKSILIIIFIFCVPADAASLLCYTNFAFRLFEWNASFSLLYR